mgnify:CR=1 FL=1
MGEEIDEISKISQPEKIRITADKTKSEKAVFLIAKTVKTLFADVELYAPENTELTVFYDNAVSVECKRYLCRKNEI